MTSARMALVTALALVFVSVLSQAAVHQFEENRDSGGLHLVREDGSFVEIAYRIESLRLDDVHTGGEALKQLTVPGLFLPGPEGAPDLPGFSRFIAIPEGATARFEVVRATTETIAGVDLAPGVRVPFENDDSPLVYRKDPAIYSVDALYPLEPVTLSAPTELRGVDVVVLAVTPFQYNPVAKELLVTTDIEIRVSFEGGGRFGEDRLRNRYWEPILEQHLLNYASLPVIDFTDTPSRDEYGEYEYVIVTPDDPAYTSWADSLRQWRTLQGIDTGVVTLTDIGSGTTGGIEDWIDEAYTTWVTPPVAILFLGDYVASGSTDGITSPIYDAYCVSDNIYADVDGENLPDIVVSRMTATPATIGDLVSKVIDYERHPVTDPGFYDHPIVAGGYQTDRWFILCTEIIYGFWTNVLGKSPVREYAIVDLPPGSQWSTYWRTQAIIRPSTWTTGAGTHRGSTRTSTPAPSSCSTATTAARRDGASRPTTR